MLPAVLLKDLYDGSLLLEDEKRFFRKAGLLFDGMEIVLDALRGRVFPFKTTDVQPGDLETTLTLKPQTSAPIIEDVSGIPQYNIPSR